MPAMPPMPIVLLGSAKCPHAHIWGPFWQSKVSRCLYFVGFLWPLVVQIHMPIFGFFLAVQSVPMPIYGTFWQCKVSPCPYVGWSLLVQSVPMPIFRGLFGSAKCPHAHM